MASLDHFAPARSSTRPDLAQAASLLVGLATAVGLTLLAQGTDQAQGGPEWHGNAGPMPVAGASL